MPRQTPEQLRAETIDAAAMLFARHGPEHTALQQIADAVGYSKAGLLHYFPNKASIYDAVIDTTVDQVNALVAAMGPRAPGSEQDARVVDLSIDMTYRWPGIAAFCVSLSDRSDAMDERLVEAAATLGKAWGIEAGVNDDRTVRVLVASTGLTSTAIAAVHADMRREWRSLIHEAAMNALGHTR